MIVCVCRRVSDRAIERKVREGCRSFEMLQSETGLGTNCGACIEHGRAAFECRRLEGAEKREPRIAFPESATA